MIIPHAGRAPASPARGFTPGGHYRAHSGRGARAVRGARVPWNGRHQDRAGVGGGSLYRLFESKEALVNAVFREAKSRLERALCEGVDADLPPRALFDELWSRLTAFARTEPLRFRFLELQDHAPYLDGESRQLELAVLAPMLLACMDFQRRGVLRADVEAPTIMAFVWGAFVGLVKSERLGYVKLGPPAFDAARDACWRAFALPDPVDQPPSEKRRPSWKRRPR